MTRVAVLKGGRSLERQVSLRSGARVEDALERLGHEVVGIDVGHDLVGAPARGRRPTWPSSPCTGATARTAPCRSCSRCSAIPYTASRRLGLHALRGQGRGQARDARRRPADARLLRLHRDRVQGARRGRRARRHRGAPALPDRRQAGRPGQRAGDPLRAAGRPTCPPRSSPPSPTARRCCSSATSMAASSPSRCWATRRCRSSRRSRARRTSTTSRRATRSGARAFVCPAELGDELTERARQTLALDVFGLLGCRGFARVDLMLEAGRPTSSTCSRPTSSRG